MYMQITCIYYTTYLSFLKDYLNFRLANELKSLEKKGMAYLQGADSDLSNFSQFVNKAEQILSKLKAASNNGTAADETTTDVPRTERDTHVGTKPRCLFR